MIVQVNGKVRGKMEVDVNISIEKMQELALSIENVKEYIKGKEIIKIIPIQGKIVNIVIK